MPASPADLAALTRAVPRVFHLLKAFGDSLHAEARVTTPMRGIMNSLCPDRARTVPDMARERPVSRQHVQAVVDELMAAGLVETRANPAHKRSPLIALTPAGQSRAQAMAEYERAILDAIAPRLSGEDVAAALRLFATLDAELSALLADLEVPA